MPHINRFKWIIKINFDPNSSEPETIKLIIKYLLDPHEYDQHERRNRNSQFLFINLDSMKIVTMLMEEILKKTIPQKIEVLRKGSRD